MHMHCRPHVGIPKAKAKVRARDPTHVTTAGLLRAFRSSRLPGAIYASDTTHTTASNNHPCRSLSSPTLNCYMSPFLPHLPPPALSAVRRSPTGDTKPASLNGVLPDQALNRILSWARDHLIVLMPAVR